MNTLTHNDIISWSVDIRHSPKSGSDTLMNILFSNCVMNKVVLSLLVDLLMKRSNKTSFCNWWKGYNRELSKDPQPVRKGNRTIEWDVRAGVVWQTSFLATNNEDVYRKPRKSAFIGCSCQLWLFSQSNKHDQCRPQEHETVLDLSQNLFKG